MATKRRNVASPREATDSHRRLKDFLTPDEIDRLLEGTKKGRHGVRDYLLVLMIYRHGLRVSEAIGLRLEAVNLNRARLWVERLKGSDSTEQPIVGDELRAIRRYLKTRKDKLPWLFISERGGPLSRYSVNHIVAEAGKRAKLGHVWPHMLRHSCGYALVDKGTDFRTVQAYLGHREIRHTVRYTRVSGKRFVGLWD
jgi:type 1 fimbriae regulatory protein FimB